MITGDRISKLADIAAALFSFFSLIKKEPAVMVSGPASAGFLKTLLEFFITLYNESGGSLNDEVAIAEMFRKETVPGTKLTKEEMGKVVAVMKHMTTAEKKIFRLIAMKLRPGLVSITIDAVLGPDGKVITPARTTTRTPKEDKSVEVLRGIAELVKDDESNAPEVLEMLRHSSVLGSDNKALTLAAQALAKLKELLGLMIDEESVGLVGFAGLQGIAEKVVAKANAPTRDESLAMFGIGGSTVPLVLSAKRDGLVARLVQLQRVGVVTAEDKKFLCLLISSLGNGYEYVNAAIVTFQAKRFLSVITVPDPRAHLPGYEPNMLERKLFRFIPGMPPMPSPATRWNKSWVAWVVLLAAILGLTWIDYKKEVGPAQVGTATIKIPPTNKIGETKE